jgi:hypothetical protein
MNRTSLASPVDWRSRRTRRVLVSGLLLVLVVWLLQSLVAPFQHPRTHLVLLSGGISGDDSTGLGPSDFVIDDFADFVPLEPVLYRGALGPGLTILGSLRSRDEMQRLGDQVAALPVAQHDVLMVYVNAEGISREATPYLAASSGDILRADEPRYPLRGLLRQIQGSPARHILIILDAGRSEFDPARGMLVNQFPRLLREEVEQLQDARLFVLCSHDEQQRSHLSHALQRSVFGYFVSQGLLGAADENGDRAVSLDELHQFVSQKVAAWVERGTGGNETQTPFLASWSGAPRQGSQPLLAVKAPNNDGIRDRHQLTIDRNRRESRMAAAATDSSRRDAARFVRSQMDRVRPRSRFGSLDVSYTPQYWRELSAWFAGGDSASEEVTNGGEGSADTQTAVAGAGEGGQEHAVTASPSTSNASTAEAGENAPATSSAPSESPAANGSAPAENSASSEKSSKTLSDSSASSDAPLGDAATLEMLLDQAWRLRDTLEELPDPHARPHDYAPHLWRTLEQQLLRYEHQYRTGAAESSGGLQRHLFQLVSELQVLAASGSSTSGRLDTLVEKIAASRPTSAVPLTTSTSLALQELSFQRQNRQLPESLRSIRDQYDNWRVSGTRSDFTKWIDELPPSAMEMPEIRFAASLRNRAYLDWDTIQLALQVVRQAEQSVVRGWRFTDWLRPKTLMADHLRHQAEQGLLNGFNFDSHTTGTQLIEALAAYREVDQNRLDLERATRLRNDLLLRVPSYLTWFRLTSSSNSTRPSLGPGFEDLRTLLADLTRLCTLLDDRSSDQLGDMLTVVERLVRQQRMLEQPLSDEAIRLLTTTPAQPGDSWQIEILLSTPLPRAAARQRLFAAAAQIEAAWAADFILPSQSSMALPQRQLGTEEWQRIRHLAELAATWLGLGLSPNNASQLYHQAVARMDTRLQALREFPHHENISESDEMIRRGALREFSTDLQSFYQNLPDRIQEILEGNADLSDKRIRAERVRRLLHGLRLLALLDPRDTPRFRTISPHIVAEQVAMYDMLDWQRQRALVARLAANQDDLDFYTNLARQYASGAQLIPRQPSLPAIHPPRLAFTGPSSLSLALQQEVEIELTLTSQHAERTETWVMLEYPEELLDIRPLSSGTFYRPDELSPAMARLTTAARLLDIPPSDIAASDPFTQRTSTWVMRPGQTERLRLRLRRRGNSSFPTRILVTAYTATEGIRWEIPVQLPAPREFEFAATGTTGSWTTTGEHWSLHPFPNRSSKFQLSLRSQIAREKKVNVQLYIPGTPLTLELPSASLNAADADTLLRSLRLPPPIAEATDLALPADGSWVGIPLLPPPEEPATAPAPSETSKTLTTTPGHRVVDSLLVVVTEPEKQQHTLTRLELAPQKPTRFLRPRVGYNLTRQRLEIEVLPQDRNLLPPEGVQVRAEFSPPLSGEGERRTDTVVTAPIFRGEMFADIPAQAEKTVTLYLHVDDYPRAFIYRVPCDQLSLDILPETEPLRVEVADLPEGTVYSAPAKQIPVMLQVDVPRGAFQHQGDFVEVGIDRQRDREFTGDSTVRLTTDRQVLVTLSDVGPEGELTFDTRVSDLRIDVADSGRQSGRANVLARVMVGGAEVWSAPVEIVLDGSGPRFITAELTTDPTVAMGTEVGVTARLDDGLLSGVAQVDVAFDQARSGQFPPEGSLRAELNASGLWTASVPTAGLPRGAYNLMLRATDRVGNVSELRKIRVQVVPEEELQPSGDALLGDIEGTVIFGSAPQASIRVRLSRLPDENGTQPPPAAPAGDAEATAVSETRTDPSGKFAFRKIPSGSYRIEANGVVFNKPRSAERTVRFSPPQSLPPIELKLP